ncbi:MAG TPA: alkaline phosphatase family protein [Membranihabitans sp.]|nr:alkaline phosphatase family protein [Membranihabitans sp.]
MKLYKLYFVIIMVGMMISAPAQVTTAVDEPKVVLITLDGLRWQELFSGADRSLIVHPDYVSDTAALWDKFWREDANKRRDVLLPFFWNVIAKQGQIYGNREEENMVNLTNQMWFSYPGYNEILTGKADDDRIDSNDKSNNPNVTVLEFIHQKPAFRGKVAAFASWDVFPYIINEERSGIPVNSGYEQIPNPDTEVEKLINRLQNETPKLWSSVRLDAFTHHLALTHLKTQKPRLLYISYGETDDFAHRGDYDEYLISAQRTDGFIREIWETVQEDPYYRDQTTIIITTDHGRGIEGDGWRHHGKSGTPHSDEVWMAFLGSGVSPKGEIKEMGQRYSNQVAATVSELLGFEYPDEAGSSLISDLK